MHFVQLEEIFAQVLMDAYPIEIHHVLGVCFAALWIAF